MQQNFQKAAAEQALNEGLRRIENVFEIGIPGLNYVMTALRSYFAVDNRYMKRKMMNVLFPFLNKEWRRVVRNFYCVVCSELVLSSGTRTML